MKNIPAYPGPSNTGFQEGMTLEDHFAGQVLCQLLPLMVSYDKNVEMKYDAAVIARHAYKIAFAMMKERELMIDMRNVETKKI